MTVCVYTDLNFKYLHSFLHGEVARSVPADVRVRVRLRGQGRVRGRGRAVVCVCGGGGGGGGGGGAWCCYL